MCIPSVSKGVHGIEKENTFSTEYLQNAQYSRMCFIKREGEIVVRPVSHDNQGNIYSVPSYKSIEYTSLLPNTIVND